MRPRKPRAIALRQLGWATLVAHLIFGVTTAGMYWQLERHGLDR